MPSVSSSRTALVFMPFSVAHEARVMTKGAFPALQGQPAEIGVSNGRFVGHPNSTIEPARFASSFDNAVPGLRQDWCSPTLTAPLVTHLLMMLRKRVRLIW